VPFWNAFGIVGVARQDSRPFRGFVACPRNLPETFRNLPSKPSETFLNLSSFFTLFWLTLRRGLESVCHRLLLSQHENLVAFRKHPASFDAL